MNTLKIGMAQISPVWLDKIKTIEKIKQYITDAANNHCDLIVFSEALLPSYPHWL
jgi:nitrilase